jgi:hypothetical protein
MEVDRTAAGRRGAGDRAIAETLGRLCDIAALRQPDDPLLVRFLPLYYSELPAGDVDDRKLDDVYAVAVAHLGLGRVRRPGQALARVLSPDRDRDGWQSPHSVLLVVTDDMPFRRRRARHRRLGRRSARGVDAVRDRPHRRRHRRRARGGGPRRPRRRAPRRQRLRRDA